MRKKWLGVALIICALISIPLITTHGPKEPRYQGKRITELIEQGYGIVIIPVEQKQKLHEKAREAVLALGTNALPYYVNCLDRTNSLIKSKFLKFVGQWNQKHPRLKLQFEDRSPAEQDYAFTALSILQAEAKPATAPLMKKWQEGDIYTKERAGIVLARIGPQNLGLLTNALLSSNFELRLSATEALSEYGDGGSRFFDPPTVKSSKALAENAKTIVPILIKHLSDNSPVVAASTLYSLGSFSRDKFAASLAIPSITNFLTASDDGIRKVARDCMQKFAQNGSNEGVLALVALSKNPNPDIRVEALDTLGYCGTNAESAIPEIVKRLNDSDPNVRQIAGMALRAVDPEAAAKAGANQ